jgi:hypothetical protein
MAVVDRKKYDKAMERAKMHPPAPPLEQWAKVVTDETEPTWYIPDGYPIEIPLEDLFPEEQPIAQADGDPGDCTGQ